MSDSEVQLSANGEQRRAAILLLALRESRIRKRRRVLVRGVVIALIGASALLLIPSRSRITPQPVVSVSPASIESHVSVEFFQTDPTIVDRLSIKPEPRRWTNIGDEELLKTLASIGQPAGIIRLGDETVLMPRDRRADQ